MSFETEKILFRLFAAQSAMYVIPTTNGMLSFLEKLISTIPGIGMYEICLLNRDIPNELDSKFWGKCISKKKIFDLSDYYLLCEKIEKNINIYPIRTALEFYGFIAINPRDLKKFIPFDSIVNNFAISFSIILENRYHEKTLELVNHELIDHRVHLQSLVKKRTNSLEKAKLKLVKTLEKTIKTLAMTVELRDPYTAGHQYRVATLAEALAKQLNLSAEKTHEIYLGALIHDIGKIQVPQEILTSPCQLTPLQFEYIKTHPEAGYKIIQPISLGATISNIILHHHERLDGSGYPHGLKGAEIPLPTRIVSVADVFEAMSSHRPYRPKHSIKATLAELKQGAGRIYDSSVVNCCIKMITEEGFKFPVVPYSQLFSHSK